jgi:hypothetical protein
MLTPPGDDLRAELWRLLREHRSENDLGRRHRLTATQQGIWLAENSSPGLSGYHDTAEVEVLGDLDVGRLRSAVAVIMRRHEALRARIVIDDGEPWQVFDRETPTIEEHDLSGRIGTTRDRFVTRHQALAATQPFDLGSGPLWRVLVLRLEPGRHRVLVVIHHLICDGASHNVLWRDLMSAYVDPDLPALQGYSDWIRQRVAAEGRAESQADEVADRVASSPRRVPLAGCRQPTEDRRARTLPLPLDASAWLGLTERARSRGLTPFSAALGVFGGLLSQLSGSPVTMAVPLARREQPGASELVGCMVDLLPVTVRSGQDDLGAGHLAWLQALGGADVPYREVARRLPPESRDGTSASNVDDPVTNLAVEQFNVVTDPLHVAGLRVVPCPRAHLRVRHDLTLTVSHDPAEIPQLLVPDARWNARDVDDLAAALADRIKHAR